METMFYIPYYQATIENWKKKKKEIKKVYTKLEDNINYSGGTQVKTHYHSDHSTIIPDIANLFTDEIKEFVNKAGVNGCYVKDAWFETAAKNDWHPAHNHGPLGYSAVCYIDFVKEEHTGTVFVSPFNNLFTGEQLIFSPQVEEGQIIFFPSLTLHYTEPNKSDTERTILSFNLWCQ